MKIDINLSTRRYMRSNVPRLLAAALFLFAVLYSFYNFYNYSIGRKELSVYAKMSAPTGKKAPVLPAGKIDAKLLEKKVDTINGIILKETFSWTELLSDLEQSIPENVSIVEIVPAFAGGRLQVKGMAKSMKDVLAFVERLGNMERFNSAFLLKHSEEEKEGRLFFTISAVYPEGRKEGRKEGQMEGPA